MSTYARTYCRITNSGGTCINWVITNFQFINMHGIFNAWIDKWANRKWSSRAITEMD